MKIELFFLVLCSGGVCLGEYGATECVFSNNNNYYITVNEMLTQPDAEAYCSKTYEGGTLYSFEDDAVNVTALNGNNYWTGIVYNERTTKYEFGNGTEITFADQIGRYGSYTKDRKLCVELTQIEESQQYTTSKCCGTNSKKNFICKSTQDVEVDDVTKCVINVNVSIDNSGSLVTNTGERRNVVCEWMTPGRFTLPGDTKVVTIEAHNDPRNVGGIFASFSNGVVTDKSWQCANIASSCTSANCTPTWGTAKEYFSPWHHIIGIAKTVPWIWVNNSFATRVWCKKTFAPQSTGVDVLSLQITGYVVVDHKGSLTSDPGANILVSQFSNWKNAKSFTLPSNVQYVTIEVEKKNNHVGGILAQFSNGYVTNSSWKCSNINSKTKSIWPPAHEIATNDGQHSQWNEAVTNIASHAKWIWTSNDPQDSKVWCLK